MRLQRSLGFQALLCAFMAIVFCSIRGSGQNAPDLSQLFTKKEAMIPMRDGVRLHTEICVPTDAVSHCRF